MKFLVDMNLSPRWVPILRAEGWDSVHWSDAGLPTAQDRFIMQRALDEQRVVLTHDLDFGAMLAATGARGPSVVAVRIQDVRPQSISPLLIPLLHQFETALEAGALLVVDGSRSRVRLLPLMGRSR